MPPGKYLLYNVTRIGLDLPNGCSYGIHLRAEQASCHIVSACNMLTSARQDLGGRLGD